MRTKTPSRRRTDANSSRSADGAPADALKQIELIAGASDAELRFRCFYPGRQQPAVEFAGRLTEPATVSRLAKLNAAGCNVYILAQQARSLPDGAFARDADVTGIRCLYADGDDSELPSEWHVEPTFTLEHENGRWWAFWNVTGDVAVSELPPMIKRIAAKYDADPRISNPSRIVRLAGYDRWKDGENHGAYRLRMRSGAPTEAWQHESLPALPPRKKHKGDPNAADVMSIERLRGLLAFVDPYDRDTWLRVMLMIRDGVVIDHAFCVFDDADKLSVIDEWASGALWQASVGPKLKTCDVGNYQGYEDCELNYSTPQSKSGDHVTFGSLVKLARDHAAKQGLEVPRRLCRRAPLERMKASGAEFKKHSAPSANGTTESAPVKPEGLYDGPELSDRPPAREIIPGVLVEASYSVASGRSQSGKSFNELALALSVATGKPWLGFEPMATGPVLYVAAEGQSRIQKDIQAWCAEFGVDPETLRGRFFVFDRSARLNTEAGQEVFDQILAWIEHVTGRLPFYAVFDTLRRNMAGGVSQEEPTSEVLNRVNDIQTRSIAVTLIAHHGRSHDETKGLTEWQDDADQVRIYSGTVAKRDTVITFSKVKTGEDGWSVAVTYAEQRLDGKGSLVAAKGERIEGKRSKDKAAASDDEAIKSILDAVVVRVLSQNHLRDWSTRKLAEAVAMDEAIGISSDALRKRYLKALREDKSTQSSACYDVHQDRWRLPPLARKRSALRVINTAKGTDEPIDWDGPDIKEAPPPQQDLRNLFKPVVHLGGRA